MELSNDTDIINSHMTNSSVSPIQADCKLKADLLDE